MEGKAKIGILRWEEGKVEKGLLQLEELPGNSTNPASYPFPVEMVHVPGACMDTILRHPDPVIKQRMIDAAKEMQAHGVKAIFGSCGFNAIWQKDIAAAVDISVCMSSLLQIPFVQQ
ncbi:MAG: aspartate/glutamate racemase family protein, partial [Firmicutes bacterium]|nr:aspartate/glutamate racemase family protein [Bacillota bacterium]